eukprot:scaffold111183_cov48-Phaeocystis_antarctica.AAC.1
MLSLRELPLSGSSRCSSQPPVTRGVGSGKLHSARTRGLQFGGRAGAHHLVIALAFSGQLQHLAAQHGCDCDAGRGCEAGAVLLVPGASDPSELLLHQPVEVGILEVTHRHCPCQHLPRRQLLPL